MNKESIMEAMDHIDPALIEAADRNTSTTKYTRRGWRRAAVIAACLCLVLAGTALAAELAGVRIVELFNSEFRSLNGGQTEGTFSGYAVAGDVTYFPVDILSPDIIKLDQDLTEPLGKHFSSWEEMEEFVGVDLMENPVLEGATVGITINLGIPGGKGHYVALVNADKDGGVPQISMVGTYSLHGRQVFDASGSHEEKVYVTVAADLLTERWKEWNLPARHSFYYVEGIEVTQEEYVAPSGLCAQIFRADYPEEKTIMTIVETGKEEPCTLSAAAVYNAEFLLNGMMFTVKVEDNSRVNGWECDSGLLRETLLEVLDGFVCTPNS